MMTYLRYWLPVGFLLLIYAVGFGLPDLSNKWPHVVIGFMALSLAWSFHFLIKQKFSLIEPQFWLGIFLVLSFISSVIASNPYAALLNWLVIFVGAIIYTLVRSLNSEHRLPLLAGLLIINFIGIAWSLLAKSANFPINWLPPIGKAPIALASLGIFAITLAVLVYQQLKNKIQKVILIVIIVLFVTVLFLPSVFQNVGKFWSTLKPQLPVAGKILKAEPIFGIGLNNYQYYYPQFTKGTSLLVSQSPNAWFESGLSFGLLPVLAFLVFLFFTFKSILVDQNKINKILISCGVVLTLLFLAFGKITDYSIVIINFWIILGIGTQALPTQEVKDKNTSTIFRYILIVAGIVLAIQSLSMGLGINRFARAERVAKSGDSKTAIGLYTQSLKFDFDPEQRRAYAESLWLQEHNNKNFALAEQQAKLAIAWNRQDAYGRQILARINFSRQNFALAEKYYLEALQRDSIFSLDIYFSLADVYKKQNKIAEEKAILKKVFNYYPENFSPSDVAYPSFFDQLKAIKNRLQEQDAKK